MAAVDPEGRIRHPLDVFHSTFNPDGTNVPAGYIATADGFGQVEYVDPATLPGGSTALADLTDTTIAAPQEDDTLRYVGGFWINDPRRFRPVTHDFGSGPELVWDGDDLVMEWF